MCDIGRIKRVVNEEAPIIFLPLTGIFHKVGEKVRMKPVRVKEKVRVRR